MTKTEAEELERRVVNCFDRLAFTVEHATSEMSRERLIQAIDVEKAAVRALIRTTLLPCSGCGGR